MKKYNYDEAVKQSIYEWFNNHKCDAKQMNSADDVQRYLEENVRAVEWICNVAGSIADDETCKPWVLENIDMFGYAVSNGYVPYKKEVAEMLISNEFVKMDSIIRSWTLDANVCEYASNWFDEREERKYTDEEKEAIELARELEGLVGTDVSVSFDDKTDDCLLTVGGSNEPFENVYMLIDAMTWMRYGIEKYIEFNEYWVEDEEEDGDND